MPDCKKMYYMLFNKTTDIIEELQAVQQQTEQLYISSEKPVIALSQTENKEEDRTATPLQK